METEIKLSLPASSRPIVEAHPLLAACEATQARNVSTYYDTPDFALRKRGVVLRVRAAADGHVQTLKWCDAAAGFASRGETEWAVGSDTIDRHALARHGEALRHVAADLDRLAPVFTTDITRTTRHLTLDRHTTVEAVLDEGEARAGDRRQPIRELELELKGGPVGPMFRLAADLARCAGLRYVPDSKSDRGYALLSDAPSPPRAAAPEPVLTDGATLGDAVPLLFGAACRDLAVDLSVAARGDVEGVHRLRAAIRRLRTLLALLGPHLDPEAAAVFDGQLRDLGRVLGRGRDWDVFLTETLADAEAVLGADALAPLRHAAAGRGSDAHAEIAAAVEGPLPTELLLGLSLWTAGRGWLRGGAEPGHVDDAEAPLRDLLPKLLDRLERKAMRRGRHLGTLETEQLHELRKALKKLRYAGEAVSSLFKPKDVSCYLGRVRKVLGDLGRINDAAVTAALLDTLAAQGSAEFSTAASDLLRRIRARRRTGERDLRRRWRKLRHADPFWS
jgi:triphosphatase